ncbi:germ cell nuclear acidic protein isoform X4 [Macaca thibetana thibetana]|uniref:germ cell nuclear acidic protein isoform X3 n=1 Tax=Macaca thibetana thibetana TaxID=257877 RepID=UPI0021BC4CDA|nr:germ cell nuclear acidic protein isoform X3 [Macaca thibetana thibetana]XP_050632301.1 germ cell nuclear acidic protein isoform X4 [Macaca thibetana thibetana]
MDGYKEELPRLQDPEEDEDCYILNVQSSSDDTNGSSVARTVPRRQVSCILNVRSRSGDTNGSSVTRRPPKRQAISVVVIDSDSDDECYTYEEKKAKLLEINSDDESPECCYVKPAIQEPPIVISDDDNDDNNSNDLEVPNKNSNDSEAPDNSNDSEAPDNNSNDSEAPDNNSNDSEAPDNNSNDSEAPDDNSSDSEAPNDYSSDSEVLNDNSSDSDVPDDNSNDSEAPEDNSNDSGTPDDNSNDSGTPDDNSNDSGTPDDNSNDSDVPDDNSNDSEVPEDNSNDSEVPDNSNDSGTPDDNSNDSDVPDDNSNDLEVPDNNSNDLEVPVPAEDLCNEGQIASNEEELGEAAVSQHDSSDDAGEQNLGENLSEPPNDPEANLEVSERKLPAEEEPAPVVEQSGKRKSKTKTIVEPLKQQKAKTKTIVEPLRKRQAKTKNIVEPLKKRKAKTKNVSVTPAGKGRKKRGPSKKKHGAAKVKKRKTRTRKCKVPGCFLHGLEKSKKYSGKNLKRNRDELVRRIYDLFNRSVCDKKLPEKLRIGWNNKMLKTAGSCSTGEMWHPKRQRFAEIQIGLKVCDSADRIRDTLIHEICHAASWLIDGIRDSHGDTWKYYARKSNRIHPELPKVTRCHNYKINYKVHYECTGCKTRIGRYTKSLDTSRFFCGKCKGSLVMVPLTQKHGTRTVPHV